MKKETFFFIKNPEALTAIAEISNSPDSWPTLISNNYGIVLDELFWENNPLLSLGEGIFQFRSGGRKRRKRYREPVKYGGGVDIHKAIFKVAPRKGFTLPGHKYTRPGNPLESQLKYDLQTREILKIYEDL